MRQYTDRPVVAPWQHDQAGYHGEQLLHTGSGWYTEKWPAVRGSHQTVTCVQASMLEIYNEEYKDLLGKALPAGKKHQV